MALKPWPNVVDEHRWSIELMEELLENTERTPEQLRSRAAELREQAGPSDSKGEREALLALADRYEQAAARLLSVPGR
jgi:hypothetical protein